MDNVQLTINNWGRLLIVLPVKNSEGTEFRAAEVWSTKKGPRKTQAHIIVHSVFYQNRMPSFNTICFCFAEKFR
jgi:hypothetical protein